MNESAPIEPTASTTGRDSRIADTSRPLVVAVPKGRILKELRPLLARAGIEPEPAFDDDRHRGLRFATNHPEVEIIRVRSFDVATFVAFGAAHIGVAGNDVLLEFDYPELYAPLDLGIGYCRLSVAASESFAEDRLFAAGHVRIATKYPETTRRYFAAQGVQAECVKLNGAMELAPSLGLCQHIVDLVSTGATLRAHGLREIACIAEITSRLIVNRSAFKTRPTETGAWIDQFREAADGA